MPVPRMSELRFWKIEQGDEDLAKKAKESFDKLYARPPRDYKFDLSDESTRFSLNNETNVYFIAGKDLDNLLGHARGYKNPPTDNIGLTSRLNGLDGEPKLFDFDGAAVTRENLSQYGGYSAYTGREAVLYIGIIEAFQQRKGIGSKLLDFIKSQGYELIELEANGLKQVRFFEANGFVDTGIDAEQGEQMVLVWNNQKYASPQNE